jgi:hypothetical protein
MLKDKYEELLKAERDRIRGTSFIPSYGKMPVHNDKFNKLMNYLDKTNKKLQVANPTEYQLNLQNLIEKQLEQARLDVLLKSLEEFRKKKGDPTRMEKILFATGFREWCGAGTDIYKNIQKDYDDPNRMFKIDTICRNHDIAYTKAKTLDDLKEADADMVFEIIEKYVVNFKKNFITGNYESDFSDFTKSYNTVYNYIVSLIEGGVNVYMMKETLLNIGKNIGSIARYGFESLIANLAAFGLEINDPQIVGAGINQNVIDVIEHGAFMNFVGDVPKIGKTVGSYYFGTMIRDRIFAMAGLLGIVYKTVIEELFDIEIISPTKHEITDEYLKNIIHNFEELQNKYLVDTNHTAAEASASRASGQPIKIGDEWTKEPDQQIIQIDKLQDDLNDIIKLNTSYIEKQHNISQVMDTASRASGETDNFLEPDEIYEATDKRMYETIDDAIDEFEKIFDIYIKEDIEEFASKKDDILTELKNIVNDIDEKTNQEPNIPQDIARPLIVPQSLAENKIPNEVKEQPKENIAPVLEEEKYKTEL